jgi:hypothetical protein
MQHHSTTAANPPRRRHRRKRPEKEFTQSGAINEKSNPKALAQLVRANAEELCIFLLNRGLLGSSSVNPRMKWRRQGAQ